MSKITITVQCEVCQKEKSVIFSSLSYAILIDNRFWNNLIVHNLGWVDTDIYSMFGLYYKVNQNMTPMCGECYYAALEDRKYLKEEKVTEEYVNQFIKDRRIYKEE